MAISHGRSAGAKLFATIDRIPNIHSASTKGLKPETCVGELKLNDVVFLYPSRPGVFVAKELNLRLPAGKTALVGTSGSGKSTVISMIERFYDSASGAVSLDGVNLKNLNVHSLCLQIGLVSQEPTLFAITIKGNVDHGLINTPYQRIFALYAI